MSEYLLTVELPSGGFLYSEDQEVPTEITLRNLTMKEEKKLLGSTGNIIDTMLKSCIVEPKNMDVRKLLIADKMFLMLKLRSHTYGSNYPVSYKCPSCGTNNKFDINIDELPIIELADEYKEPPYEITLPKNEDFLEIKLLTGQDQEDIEKLAKRQSRKFSGSKDGFEYVLRLGRHIVTVDGKTLPINEMKDYVEGLHALDSSYIWHKLSEVEVGVDTKIYEDCSNCGDELEFEMPLNAEFFRPSFSE